MKKVNIYNKKNILISENNLYENPDEFINWNVSNNTWGKPERWIIQNSEPYEETDILETEERFFNSGVINQNEDGTFTVEKTSQTWVKLKTDYIIEISDLDKDYDYLLSQCHANRKREYPPIEEWMDALVKNDEKQKQEYIDKCLEIKNKYPKPIRSNT